MIKKNQELNENEKKKDKFKQIDKFVVTNQLLGKGAFGKVYRGFFKNDHSKIIAVKMISLNTANKDPKFIEYLKREIEILKKISHPNITK